MIVIMDIFMSSIETITSKKKKVYELRDDLPDYLRISVWNDTVANLALMCLGIAAPEILLSTIETIGHGFEPGFIGAGTIVGSAAVNILVVAYCMQALRKGEIRRIRYFNVFLVTGFFHVFSFVWIYIIVAVSSPDEVEIWEAFVTLCFFPVLVFSGYATNKSWWCKNRRFIHHLRGDESKKEFAEAAIRTGTGSFVNDEGLVQYVRELRRYTGITLEDAAVVAAVKLSEEEPHSIIWYRIGGARVVSSGRPLTHKLKKRLKQVYRVLDERHVISSKAPPTTPEMKDNAIVEFESPMMAVTEATVFFPVYITRSGNMDHTIKARVTSVDGMAIHGEDFYPINEIVTFQPHQCRAEVIVNLIDERKYEPTEEFFLRLSIVSQESKVKVGKLYIMEIKIIPYESPGIIEFEKRGTVVKESAETIELFLVRKEGHDGKVSVMWSTVEQTAKAGVDYLHAEGEVIFNDGEIKKSIKVRLINTISDEKNVFFEVKIYDPTGGAMLGLSKSMKIIVTDDDDDFFDVVDKIAVISNIDVEQTLGSWCHQIKCAMLPNGGQLDTASNLDYFLHSLFFFWKVLFSLIPPVTLFGGWVSFICSLLFVALLVALVADMASIFGCAIGLHDTMTAITVVSIGASLTDGFACRFALNHGKFADNAIGNINGTAAITVFVGLGLPWLMAAVYQRLKGEILIVSSSGLGTTVLSYTLVCTITLGLLIVRRKLRFFGRAEIGGPNIGRIVSSIILVSLWIIFVLLTYLDVQGIIDVF